jgi:hypothetical protein
MDRSKTLFWILTISSGLFFLAGWVVLILWEIPLPVPLGALPLLALTVAFLSAGAFYGALALSVALYIAVFVSLRLAQRERRVGTTVLTVIYVLDLAANIILIATSWWYLLGAALDAAMLLAVWRMAFPEGKKNF